MSIHQIHNDEFAVKINSIGAELCSVYSKKYKLEYTWQAEESLWPRHAPNLFPIVGKLKSSTFNYKDKNYNLPQHGFARDSEFNCIEETETKLVFELKSSKESLKNFPFQFSFKIIYSLTNNNLLTEYSIFNPAETELYFSVGAHPAFNCPIKKNETFEDYILEFPTLNDLVLNTLNDGLIKEETKSVLLNDHKLKISTSLFDNDALVLMNSQIVEVSLKSIKSNHGVTMKCEKWPFFGIWTKKNSNKFICLEPWFGIADMENANQNLINKIGIIKLDSHQNFKCSFVINFY